MYPTLITIGRLSLPSYTVLLDLGLLLGLILTHFEGRRLLGNGERALDAGLWSILGGIVGGRFGFVLANRDVFGENWARALRVWEGGLAFHGAFLGGLIALGLFILFQYRRLAEEDRAGLVPHLTLLDALAPGLALGLAFGWAACLLGGCAYGAVGLGPGFAVLPDFYGVQASRFLTQPVGLGYTLILLAAVWLLRRRWPFRGAGFLLFALFYFAGQFILDFSRGDEALTLGPWRLSQVLNLALAVLAAAGLLFLWWRWCAKEVEDKEVPEP